MEVAGWLHLLQNIDLRKVRSNKALHMQEIRLMFRKLRGPIGPHIKNVTNI